MLLTLMMCPFSERLMASGVTFAGRIRGERTSHMQLFYNKQGKRNLQINLYLYQQREQEGDDDASLCLTQRLEQ